MTSRERADEWKRAWSQQEEQTGNNFTLWCYDIVRKLRIKNLSPIYVFNCSDGPAALGIILGLMEKTKSLDITLTDIHEYAIEAANEYTHAGLQLSSRTSSVSVRTQIWDTRQLLVHQQPIPINYIAFEPIGVDIELFESAYQMLLPGSSISVIGRGVMGPISYLGIAGKHVDGDVSLVTGMETPSGNVAAVMLSK